MLKEVFYEIATLSQNEKFLRYVFNHHACCKAKMHNTANYDKTHLALYSSSRHQARQDPAQSTQDPAQSSQASQDPAQSGQDPTQSSQNSQACQDLAQSSQGRQDPAQSSQDPTCNSQAN